MGVNSCGTTLIDQGVFENIGAITWDTTVKTSGFTAVSGNGYFCNTTSAAFTVTLPASPSAGDVVAIADYANTFDTNNVTIGRNGSNIQGSADDVTASIEGLSVTLIYVDGTQGWLLIDAAQASDIVVPNPFIEATGGTITTSGNFKIHTFTGPGTFTVCQVSETTTENTVGYMVVAGGGGGGTFHGGGGGAGGFREGRNVPIDNFTASPLVANAPTNAITISATSYPITVGAGGAGAPTSPDCGTPSTDGSNSVFSSITSTGGGGGGSQLTDAGHTGGSGGGGTYGGGVAGGAGNTPPTSPSQGETGGTGYPGSPYNGGGGGGATQTGRNAGCAATGGAGATTSISASSVAYAGGGGGGGTQYGQPSGGAGGTGGGGAGANSPGCATAGTANRGGGAGGGNGGVDNPNGAGATGGSGIVIIRYKFQ
ncbi:glycine-rich domain-containing protein [uncultured Brevundimonas sp.]|uniref:glycine-rich domain-containing protein n=1 Tax=uncultured Brevundimonas sp. TaxID=213418 RepID=UPI0030ECC4F4|tara:strand:+ start:1142 stop:2422 length:1281 start_codon:yes stop_codon:yes gene_type:complete